MDMEIRMQKSVQVCMTTDIEVKNDDTPSSLGAFYDEKPFPIYTDITDINEFFFMYI